MEITDVRGKHMTLEQLCEFAPIYLEKEFGHYKGEMCVIDLIEGRV